MPRGGERCAGEAAAERGGVMRRLGFLCPAVETMPPAGRRKPGARPCGWPLLADSGAGLSVSFLDCVDGCDSDAPESQPGTEAPASPT